MSMITRSKSVPKQLGDVSSLSAKLPRTRTAQTTLNTPAPTPWKVREDPFSLLGFFPPSRPTEQVECDWIRSSSQELEDDDDKIEEDSSIYHGLLGQNKTVDYDELIRQVIDGEDKFGMLAFSSEKMQLLPMFERAASPVQLSVDEASDLDALHTKHCLRRRHTENSENDPGPELGSLFFGGETEREEGIGSWVYSWTKRAYAQVMSVVVGL